MSYRFKRLSALTLALGLLVALTAAQAAMRGNTYSNDQHQVSFSRPDASWELRDNPAQENAVALFSNGQGRVIALLSHRVLDPSDVITSPGNLRDRWSALVDEIAAMGSAGETGISIFDADYDASENGVTFELNYTSQSRAMGGKVRNWVTGLMVRDSDNRQHIYTVRCAAADGIFDSWVSQFEHVAPTLSFTGQRQMPFYTSAPMPWWWFALGALALIVAVKFALRGRRTEPMVHQRPRPHPEVAPQTLPPMGSSPDMDDDFVPNVPDQMLVAAELDDASNDIPDQMYHEAAAEGQIYNEGAPPAGFWKCECGRVNAGDEDFCVRCNADRVRA